MSQSLGPHRLQHARLPCPSPTPGACSNSCPLSRWCYPTISSSVIPFSSCLQTFPASGSLQMSPFFPSGVESIETSASVSVLQMNIQGWFPLGLTGLISLLSKGFSRVFSSQLTFGILLLQATLELNSHMAIHLPFHIFRSSDLLLIGKDSDAGKDWRQEEKGTTEDEMVGWHHWLNGREFEQVPGVGDGQGSLTFVEWNDRKWQWYFF